MPDSVAVRHARAQWLAVVRIPCVVHKQVVFQIRMVEIHARVECGHGDGVVRMHEVPRPCDARGVEPVLVVGFVRIAGVYVIVVWHAKRLCRDVLVAFGLLVGDACGAFVQRAGGHLVNQPVHEVRLHGDDAGDFLGGGNGLRRAHVVRHIGNGERRSVRGFDLIGNGEPCVGEPLRELAFPTVFGEKVDLRVLIEGHEKASVVHALDKLVEERRVVGLRRALADCGRVHSAFTSRFVGIGGIVGKGERRCGEGDSHRKDCGEHHFR